MKQKRTVADKEEICALFVPFINPSRGRVKLPVGICVKLGKMNTSYSL